MSSGITSSLVIHRPWVLVYYYVDTRTWEAFCWLQGDEER